MIMAYVAFLFLTFWPMVALSFPDDYLMHAREPLITQAPGIDDHPLFARGDVSTCGFVSGDASMSPSPHTLSLSVQFRTDMHDPRSLESPLTCPTSYSCTSTIQLMLGWACCDQIQCAGNYYTCVDYGAQLCDGLDAAGCSSIYISILSW